MEIKQKLTKVNYRKGNRKVNKYLVIHFVGATGGAEANCNYFYNTYRGASAHYFVGHFGEVWQCVEDKNIAWHCGANKYKHAYCRNTNSIGIEMCCKKDKSGKWYFEDATVKATVELVKDLMKKYNIPVANVIRHYDVTGKNCPEPYVRDAAAWASFKAALGSKAAITEPTGYIVRVTADKLNVRTGGSVLHNIVTQVKKGEAFTIVEEKNGWGKLKSGKGWISLKYTEKV